MRIMQKLANLYVAIFNWHRFLHFYGHFKALDFTLHPRNLYSLKILSDTIVNFEIDKLTFVCRCKCVNHHR